MPDIIAILTKRGRLIFLLTLAATILALLVSLLRPKEYLATATAIPSNSALSDKARLFNNNIEALYPELGSPDELDRVEGTAKLDTIFLAVVDSFGLAATEDGNRYKAATALKKSSDIRRSAYGELKISVWNADAAMAANLANALLMKLNAAHQQVQSRNNTLILQTLKTNLLAKQKEMDSLQADRVAFETDPSPYTVDSLKASFRHPGQRTLTSITQTSTYPEALQNQINQHQEMIGKYELAVATSPQLLVPVEHARPALSPDKPKVLQTVLLAFGASLLFSFLLAILLESRRPNT